MTKKNQNRFRYVFIIGITFFAAWGVVDFFTFSKTKTPPKESSEKTKPEDIYGTTDRDYYAFFAMPVPDELNFAGERIPSENFDVKESLDLEFLKVAYWHSEFFLYLKKAHRFFPVVEPILKKNNIPEDFKYLMVTESGLSNVTSPAGAKGFWQFLSGTAKSYGLEVSREVDERYHIEKATAAACKYLKEAYQRYGSWTLAAASYNVGIGNLDDRIELQGTKNYYDLLLNPETGRYIYRVAAVKTIMQNPQEYGFYFHKHDLYPLIETKTVKTDSSGIDLIRFAADNGTNYKILRMLNPWLRSNKLTNSRKKTYEIKIPVVGARQKDYFADETDKDLFINTIEF